MNELNTPEMSVILVTPGRFNIVAGTLEHMRAQTIRDRLEIVIVAPSREELQLGERQLDGFRWTRVVEVGEIKSMAQGNAAGIRRASAPVVALTENHCFPEPGWAEAMLRAHHEPVAAVGPVFLSANPESLIGWTNFLIEYGPWLDPIKDKFPQHLPGHNSSYKRDILLEYGSALADLMEAESNLHWDLHRKGHTFRIEPDARTRHLNVSRLSSSIPLRFNVGRSFAAFRAQKWSFVRRAIYAFASPLIPLIRLRRTLEHLRRIDRYALSPRILPLLAILLAVDACGEFVGYSLGTGDSASRLNDIEFHRERHIHPSDKQEYAIA